MENFDMFINLIQNRIGEVMSNEDISIRQKLTRINELENLLRDLKLRKEVEEIYNELGES